VVLVVSLAVLGEYGAFDVFEEVWGGEEDVVLSC
jgi:hypothetical protein